MAVIRCPRCKSNKLKAHSTKFDCTHCGHSMPFFDGLACVTSNNFAFLAQWQARAQALGAAISQRRTLAEQGLTAQHVDLTRQRLDRVLTAQTENFESILRLLPSLKGANLQSNPTPFDTALVKIPKTQHLESYFSNIFRDWVWGDVENKASFLAVKGHLREPLSGAAPQRIAVIGSGAGRLATDLADGEGRVVFALDTNPLLLKIHELMLKGQSIKLNEIPVNPVSIEKTVVEQVLPSMPNLKTRAVYPLLMNGLSPSFQHDVLDAIVTPWFVDVVPEDFVNLAARYNGSLKVGGQFIFFGPLGFSNPQAVTSYTPEEIVAILNNSGFQVSAVEKSEIDYLHSAYNPQKRRETVVVIAATKIKKVKEPPEYSLLPDWLTQTSAPIALTEPLRQLQAQTRIQLEILSQIDGAKSFDDIARLFEIHYKISADQAKALVINLLTPLLE